MRNKSPILEHPPPPPSVLAMTKHAKNHKLIENSFKIIENLDANKEIGPGQIANKFLKSRYHQFVRPP